MDARVYWNELPVKDAPELHFASTVRAMLVGKNFEYCVDCSEILFSVLLTSCKRHNIGPWLRLMVLLL